MADEETRPSEEPEVEGHGPRTEGPRGEGPRTEGPRSELHDDEPDVEAHGPRTEGPRTEGPRHGRPSQRVGAQVQTLRKGPVSGPFLVLASLEPACAERASEVAQQAHPCHPLFVLEAVHDLREASDDVEVSAVLLEDSFRAAGAQE